MSSLRFNVLLGPEPYRASGRASTSIKTLTPFAQIEPIAVCRTKTLTIHGLAIGSCFLYDLD